MSKYDIIIVGAGASGVFMSYELTKLNVDAKILMIEKGGDLFHRNCPIKAGRTPTCIKCSPCHIMNGYGGAGTLSDGKYNITNKFGSNHSRRHQMLDTEKRIRCYAKWAALL